jgi:glycosyltransferase involved in cell wall biosynthesis
MKIGLSLVDLAMGGAQNFFVQLAQGLASRGHTISTYLHASRDDPIHTATTLLISLESVAEFVTQPRNLLACDVIQLDGYHNLRRKLPYLPVFHKCVETYHSSYSIQRSGPFYTPHRVAMSQAIQAALKRSSQVIYQGVPLPEVDWEANRPFDIAILGRIHPVKQHLLFLDICELLYQQRGSLNALLISGHPQPSVYQEKVDKEIVRLQQSGLNIYLTGYLDSTAVYAQLAQAKILLVTSESEGYGRMAVEGLSCGLPVVSNPVGGLLEIIKVGQTGYFTELNNASSFAEYANLLLDDPSLCQALARRGRADVEKRFSYEAMLDAYEKLYHQIAQ